MLNHGCVNLRNRLFFLIIHFFYPQALETPNEHGQLPLHVAAKHGATHFVTNFLVEKNGDAAAVQDNAGMIPLHHACASHMKNYKPVKGKSHPPTAAEAVDEVVATLCAAAPLAVNIKDNKGASPIEHAIENDLPLSTVNILVNTAKLYSS